MASKFVVNKAMQDVDNLAKLRRRIATLKAEEAEIAERVTARLAKRAGNSMHGYVFDVQLSNYDLRTLNQAKVAKYLTEAQLNRCFNVTVVNKLVFTKVAAVE